MKHCLALLIAMLFLWSGTPAHAQAWHGVEIDPQGLIRPQLLQSALAAYQQHLGQHLSSGSMAVVDFAKPSSQRRLYLVDMISGEVKSFLVAHGRGSDSDHDAMADKFSDAMGSHASSLGAFRADARYQGQHGLSLALDGLDPSNRSARERAVVVHSQWYVSDRMIAEHGRLGRSWGCFVVDPAVIESLVQHLEGGGFLYAGR